MAWPATTWTRPNVNVWLPWNPLLRKRRNRRRGGKAKPVRHQLHRTPTPTQQARWEAVQYRPGSRDSPCGPSPGTWAWPRTPRRSTPRQMLHPPRNSAPRSELKPRLWPHRQRQPINPGDIFAFQKRGRNRWTTTQRQTGIDVSKTRLDASAGGGQVHSFANDGEGTEALLEWLAAQGVDLVVCDPPAATRSLRCAACIKGSFRCTWPIPTRYRPSPWPVDGWLRPTAWTPRTLSRYGQVFASAQASQPEPEGEELQALLRRRRQLVNQREQERNRLDWAWNPAVRASTQGHIEWLDQEIAALDHEYREALE